MPAYGVLLFMFFVFCTGCIGLGYYYHRQEGGGFVLLQLLGLCIAVPLTRFFLVFFLSFFSFQGWSLLKLEFRLSYFLRFVANQPFHKSPKKIFKVWSDGRK